MSASAAADPISAAAGPHAHVTTSAATHMPATTHMPAAAAQARILSFCLRGAGGSRGQRHCKRNNSRG
jgi:hypothetical protein